MLKPKEVLKRSLVTIDYCQLLLMLMFETYLNEIENEHTPKLTNCIVSLKISLNIGGVPTPIICCQKWEFQKFLP